MSYMSRILVARSQSNFALSKTVAGHSAIGARNARSRIARSRILVLVMCFVTLYGIVGLRLMQYGLASRVVTSSLGNVAIPASRPEITDRNGEMLATDLDMVSLYAEPRRIVDVDEAVEKLASVVPQLDWQDTYRKLKSQSAFQWLRRQLNSATAGRYSCTGHSWHRFPAGKKTLLSRRFDRGPYPWPR